LKTEVRICGLGGQGVILAGQILGRAAAYDGKNVVQTQTYGAEARGSAAKSEVIISDSKIGYPMVRKCDVLVTMSQEAAEANIKDLKENGTLIIDGTTVTKAPETKARIVKISATHEAEASFGARLYANMIMLGTLNEATKIVSEKAMQKAIEDTVVAKDAEANKQAYRKGRGVVS
jgi:2-oxoglutarate ferredoxin oxidoreductase subunit gamma